MLILAWYRLHSQSYCLTFINSPKSWLLRAQTVYCSCCFLARIKSTAKQQHIKRERAPYQIEKKTLYWPTRWLDKNSMKRNHIEEKVVYHKMLTLRFFFIDARKKYTWNWVYEIKVIASTHGMIYIEWSGGANAKAIASSKFFIFVILLWYNNIGVYSHLVYFLHRQPSWINNVLTDYETM